MLNFKLIFRWKYKIGYLVDVFTSRLVEEHVLKKLMFRFYTQNLICIQLDFEMRILYAKMRTIKRVKKRLSKIVVVENNILPLTHGNKWNSCQQFCLIRVY